MGRKRKAAALALLSGYASGSDSGGDDSDASRSSSSSEPQEAGPVQGPAGPPSAEAPDEEPAAGPCWRPADGEYEELPEAPPEEEEEEEAPYAQPPPGDGGGAEGGAADAPPLRHVSVPASLDVAPPLPPPPDEPCAPELQAKLLRYHALLQSGRSINAELRKSKGYRNPDFLQKIVEFFGIREHGSCYPRELFDPDALLAEDYYDALTAAQRAQSEAREAERSKRGIVEFTVGGVQQGTGGAYAAALAARGGSALSSQAARGSRWG